MFRIRRISKKYYLRQIVASWLVVYMFFFFGIPVRVAMATPEGGVFTVGTGDITQGVVGGNNTVVVHQTESVIEWGSPGSGGIDTSSSESLSFSQLAGLSNSAVLNRIKSGNITQFDGTLNGVDMRIFIINPAGIIFGSGATINVAQLVASSLDIADSDFLNGAPYQFTGGIDAGNVTNYATNITAELVALIGKNVFNRGALTADKYVIMAAGDSVLITESGSSVAVKVFMPDGWVSGSSVHDVKNEDGRINAEHVILAAGDIWSAALVKAYSDGGPDAVATIDIDAAGDVTVTDKVMAEAVGNGENNATATVTVNAGGDVGVISDGGDALIQAETSGGGTNTSDVLICADGYVTVEAKVWKDLADRWHGGVASIEAIADYGYNNDASVSIGAKEGINVSANGRLNRASSEASISSKAINGQTNTAETIVCTKGDVAVIGNGGYVAIGSEALDGYLNDAYTGVSAEGDILVAAGFDPYLMDDMQGMGGEAEIYSEARAEDYIIPTLSLDVQEQLIPVPMEPSTANARTVAVSKKGGVAVAEITGGYPADTASIIAEAYNAYTNTASVGVAAGADLSPADALALHQQEGEGLLFPWYIDDEPIYLSPGDVIVDAYGADSDARILSHAYNGYENTADTVVCAPGEIYVYADEGSVAKIKSWAGWWGDEGVDNHATTQVYASDVKVEVPNFARGNGIQATAGSDVAHPDYTDYCLTEDDALAITNGSAVLIIDTYANRKDCPTCPPCPCGKEGGLLAPVAPLAQFTIPRVEGCPLLTQAAAMELGITGETIQVAIGNALALNPNIQPCRACAKLVNYAAILSDADGSRMAALNQVFNEIAPSDAPFTPEMAGSIATAFAERIENTDMPQYALAMEYIDAFVGYVAVLDKELGSPVGDSLTFLMKKHGEPVTTNGNANIAAYLEMRLAALGG